MAPPTLGAMLWTFLKWSLLLGWLASIAHIHLRGRVRLSLGRQLFDHSSLFAPMNTLLHACSALPAQPYLPLQEFPELAELQRHWPQIRAEALALRAQGRIRAALANDDAGFNSFFKYGWKRFYLCWYGARLPSAERLCPHTVALLRRMPRIRGAMFAALPPGGRLNLHRDPFAGALRFHLGLATPNDARCYIDVDGQRHVWHDGEGVLFDETYLHYAENTTSDDRIILFCDVERPLTTGAMTAVNRWVSKNIINESATQNEEGEHVGWINRIFGYVYHVRLVGKRMKAWNKRVYYVTKYALIGVIVAAFLATAFA